MLSIDMQCDNHYFYSSVYKRPGSKKKKKNLRKYHKFLHWWARLPGVKPCGLRMLCLCATRVIWHRLWITCFLEYLLIVSAPLSPLSTKGRMVRSPFSGTVQVYGCSQSPCPLKEPPIEGVTINGKWSSDHRRNGDRSWGHYSLL